MIAELAVPRAFTRTRSGHRTRPHRAGTVAVGVWVRVLDDQQATRLKVLLLLACVLASALLEVPVR